MSLDDIIALQITKNTTAPTRLGFGIPLIMAAHSVAPDLVLQFKSLAAMVSAGFIASDPAYQAAQAAFSQNPKPAMVVVGKRSNVPTMKIVLTPKSAREGDVYKFSFVSPLGVITALSYVVPAASTLTSVATDLAALIPTTESVVATKPTATTVQITAPAGKLFDLKGLPSPKLLAVDDTTTDPGIAADLAAVYEEDPTTWWAVSLDSQSPAEVAATAAWVETVRKLQIATTSQSDILTSATDDLASTLKASSYARTALIFSKNRIRSYANMAWLGCQLPKTPGSSTWAYKTLAGIVSDTFTDGENGYLAAKNCNRYQVIGGVPVTQEGYCCDGTKDFLDVVQGVDWLYARIQEAIFGALANQEKIPYTDDGVASIVSLIKGVLSKGVKATLLAKDPAPFVNAPKVADIDASEKINRNLPDITFGATLAGAIHRVAISGVLSV